MKRFMLGSPEDETPTMVGGEVPAVGAWSISNSTPIRLNKFAMGGSFTPSSAGQSSGRWLVSRAASAVLRPLCA